MGDRVRVAAAVVMAIVLMVSVAPIAATASGRRAESAEQPSAAQATTRPGLASSAGQAGPMPHVRPGEVIVRFRRSAGAGQRLAALEHTVGATADRRAAVADEPVTVSVRPGAEAVAAAQLARDPAVVYAEPNYIRRALSHDSGEIPWSVDAVRAPSSWGAGFTGSGVRVAVVDSGVDRGHPQLKPRVASGRDVYDFSGDGGDDDCGHGTAVAGIVAAKHDGHQTVGVAYASTIVPVKVLYLDEGYGACVGDDLAIAEGIRWAARTGDADVVNLSLGGPGYSRTLAEAVNDAVAEGAIVVAASGNSGDRVPSYPAALPGVISVGGLTRSDKRLVWWRPSTFGSVDVAAPASRVRVIKARSVRSRLVGDHCGFTDGTLCTDGTSFASPHVAGVAALLLQQHDGETWSASARVRRVRQWLLGTAAPVPAGSARIVDLQTGHGVVDAARARIDSTRGDVRLLTWNAKRRIISPTSALLATPTRASVSAFISDGRGVAKSDVTAQFSTRSGGSTSYRSTSTDTTGRATTVFRSTAAGTTTRLSVSVAGRTLPLEMYVLQRDDNIRGLRLTSTVRRNRLSPDYDSDDVYRFRMREHEQLRATLEGIDSRSEYIDMWLFRPSARDVTSGKHAPMHEDTDRFEFDPLRLSKRVPADGTYYLDLYGIGSYRLRWRIRWPDRVVNLNADPAPFSPNGDGYRDRTTISWRLRTRGLVKLEIRDRSDRVRRSRDFGREPAGRQTWTWGGRDNTGDRLPEGRYRVVISWANGHGRVSSSSVRLQLNR